MFHCVELGKDYRLAKAKNGLPKFYAGIESGFRRGHLKTNDFSIRDMFEHLVPDGRALMESWRTVNGGGNFALLEAQGAVDTAAFSKISGQLLITRVLELWNNPQLMWRELVEVIPTTLNGEKLVGIAPVADEIDTVPEQGEYPQMGLQELWVQTPQLVKKGGGISVTKEAILHDQTNLIMRRAQSIVDGMGFNMEKRILDMVFGITNSYNRMGTPGNTYLTSGAYVNVKTSNALADFTSIDAAIQLFSDMTDPDTGEPIIVGADTIIIPKALETTLTRLMTATGVRVASGPNYTADPTDNAEYQTYSPFPVKMPYKPLTNEYVKARTSSNSTWFIGKPKKAFALMEGWPIQVTQAPANSEADFNRDVIARWKVSHYGVPAVLEPRYMIKNTA